MSLVLAAKRMLLRTCSSLGIFLNKRRFLTASVLLSSLPMATTAFASKPSLKETAPSIVLRIFMVGDVMLGRGVDQILRYHVDPILYEGYIENATEYTQLAIDINGPLPPDRPVGYVWGDAIEVLKAMRPDLRLINLETAVTEHETPWPDKGINYRMHPGNVEVIQSAEIDCCILSNNHVLDWSRDGLAETLGALRDAGLKFAGAGLNLSEAQAPAIFEISPPEAFSGPHPPRILVFAGGHVSSGVPYAWRATSTRSGVNYVDIESSSAVKEIAENIKAVKQPGDVVIFSIHWGSNWNWNLEAGQKTFAHRLIDDAGVDIIHGHSSHHIKGVEVYKGKLIIYGCGDFLSDYEGITSPLSDRFRDDLSFMYFADVDSDSGRLLQLQLVPMMLRRIQTVRANEEGEYWLFANMQRECARCGLEIERQPGVFKLKF